MFCLAILHIKMDKLLRVLLVNFCIIIIQLDGATFFYFLYTSVDLRINYYYVIHLYKNLLIDTILSQNVKLTQTYVKNTKQDTLRVLLFIYLLLIIIVIIIILWHQ
jgi:hypothetical protein